jgi:XRE family transcriptional regulator, regulator of sulfur utilization
MVDDRPDGAAGLGALARGIARAVRAHRLAQGMSLGDLARASGLSKTILARIERAEGNPSVETLWRLSSALGLPLGTLMAQEAAPRLRVMRAAAGSSVRGASGMAARLLHAEGRAVRSEVFELDLPAGTEQLGAAHLPGTEELVVCTAGRLVAGPLGEEVELGASDAVWFQADVAHRYAAVEDARALDWILYAGAGGAG